MAGEPGGWSTCDCGFGDGGSGDPSTMVIVARWLNHLGTCESGGLAPWHLGTCEMVALVSVVMVSL